MLNIRFWVHNFWVDHTLVGFRSSSFCPKVYKSRPKFLSVSSVDSIYNSLSAETYPSFKQKVMTESNNFKDFIGRMCTKSYRIFIFPSLMRYLYIIYGRLLAETTVRFWLHFNGHRISFFWSQVYRNLYPFVKSVEEFVHRLVSEWPMSSSIAFKWRTNAKQIEFSSQLCLLKVALN